MVWCGVVWCGVVWCGVVWCGVVWCGVVWCGVVWCGVVWCGVVWCGVVWCGVVWCGVPKALLPNGNGQDALQTSNAKREGCVSKCALCVVCCAPVAGGCHSLWRRAAAVQGCPGDILPLCLMVLPKFLLAHAFVPLDPGQAVMRPALGRLRYFCTLPHCVGQWAVGVPLDTATLQWAVGSGQCKSFHTLLHSPGAVGSGTPSALCLTALGSGEWNSFCTLLTAWGQWAVGLLLYTASLPAGLSGMDTLQPSVWMVCAVYS